MKRLVFMAAVVCACFPLFGFKTEEIQIENNSYLSVESDSLLLYFNRQGGRLDRIFYKQGNMELVERTGRSAFTENDWNRDNSRDFLYKRMFNLTTERSGDTLTVICKGHHMGGGIDFLEVTKRYTIRRGSPVITLEYDFHNQVAAMSKVLYSLHIHTGLTLVGEGTPQYYMPGTDGIKKGNGWQHSPSRGWLAVDSPRGIGLAVTMSFPELYNFLVWGATTMEWRYVPMDIENGKSFKTKVELIPFSNLPLVSGAGNGVVGALIHAEKAAADSKEPVEVRINNGGRAGKLEIELFRRKSGETEWTSMKKAELVFRNAPETQSFQADAAGNGSVELEAVVRSGGKELTRLNSRILFGDADAAWKIDVLEAKRESDLQEVDLTGFSHVKHDPAAVRWAKPLPGGKLKMLAFASQIPQLGDLSDRIDMTFATSWIVQDGTHLSGPDCLLCDNYGKTNMNDVMNNIRKALKGDYDVIFIAGISWRLFPKDIQESILGKIKGGAGLVYTGVDEGHPFLNLSGPYRRKVNGLSPQAVKNSELTSGVPFDFFPAAEVFALESNGEIHAKAGSHPYIVSGVYGKGTVVGYCYAPNLSFTGIIPSDSPEPYYIYRNPTPYEIYFAMIAKGILYAADRKPAFSFGGFRAEPAGKEMKFTWNISSDKALKCRFEYRITDRNNELRSKGAAAVKIAADKSEVSLTLPMAPYAGKQLISVVARNEKGESLNWGSWSLAHEPAVKIASVTSDKNAYADGDTVAYKVEFSSVPGKRQMRVELVDSYGRVLQSREGAADEISRGSFLLSNELPARYSKIRAYLLENGGECDTGGSWFYTRPAEKLLAWDDYKINSIIYWTGADSYYRMHRTADVYRKLGLNLLMNNWGLHHVLLNNFEPRMWVETAIGSQNFPSKEYLGGGNKMLLARKECLSDKHRNGKYLGNLVEKGKFGYRYGAMFYDNGDEIALSRSGSPVDFCFSEHCLENLREFLKARYGDLEKLNAAWETAFKNWNEVVPFTKDEVWAAKGKHVAGWADHREFMEWLCYHHLKQSRDTLKKYDPTARYSNSGTIYPNAYGGLDWWKLMQVYDCLQNYPEHDQDEFHRSFARKGYVSIPWYVGYGCKGQEQVYRVWRSALLGSSGISLWCLHSGILYPDLRMQSGTLDALPHTTTLKQGVGKLLMDIFKPRPAEVAVLYSQASLRAAFIEKRMEEHQGLWEKYTNLCRNLGAEFKFVSYEQLAKGELDDSSYKLLVLADATALSDAEIEAVKCFFDRGGCVLAEGVPATRFENCVKRKTPALKNLFRGSKGRAVLMEEPDTDYTLLLAAPDSQLNRKQLLSEQGLFEVRLKKSGIAVRPFQVLHMDGTPVIEAQYFLRKSADGSWLGGITTRNQTPKEVKIVLPEAGHVFNLVTGKYLGEKQEVILEFCQGMPTALAVLKEKPAWLEPSVAGGTVGLRLNHAYGTVAHIRVYAPGGKEVPEYGRNIILEDGTGSYRIPFALSDRKGEWKLIAKEAVSGETVIVNLEYR